MTEQPTPPTPPCSALALFADLHRELLAVKPMDMQEALAEAAAQGPEALEATQEECEAVLMQVRWPGQPSRLGVVPRNALHSLSKLAALSPGHVLSSVGLESSCCPGPFTCCSTTPRFCKPSSRA